MIFVGPMLSKLWKTLRNFTLDVFKIFWSLLRDSQKWHLYYLIESLMGHINPLIFYICFIPDFFRSLPKDNLECHLYCRVDDFIRHSCKKKSEHINCLCEISASKTASNQNWNSNDGFLSKILSDRKMHFSCYDVHLIYLPMEIGRTDIYCESINIYFIHIYSFVIKNYLNFIQISYSS